ncbi:MAG: BCCT family transporter [Clostridia bacterium]
MKKHFEFLDKWVYFVSVGVIGIVLVLLQLIPTQVTTTIESAFSFLIGGLQPIYILLSVVCFIFFIYLVFSKYADVKFGGKDDKPAYSEFSWAAMIFTSGAGSSTIILGFAEPLYYLVTTPFEIEPYSKTAYEYAHMYGQFHWGFSAWAFYVPAIVAIGYFVHVKKAGNITIGSVVTTYVKHPKLKVLSEKIIDIFVVFGIVMSITTSLGLGVPVLAKLLSYTLGIENGVHLQYAVFAIWFIIFTWSVVRGLDKGIKILSDLNMGLIFLFLAVFVCISPIMDILSMEINSIGIYISELPRMIFYTDPFGDGALVSDWTAFYWAWWISFISIMGIFIARVSAGRTIRQVVVGQLVWGSLGCCTFLGILGGYSLHVQSQGEIDLVNLVQTEGNEAAILAIFNTLPMGDILIILMCILCFVFLATTIDSTAYVLSIVTSTCSYSEEPPTWIRASWAIVIFLLAITLTIVGGLALIQKLAIVVAFPLVFVIVFLIVLCLKVLKANYSHLTREEIKQLDN